MFNKYLDFASSPEGEGHAPTKDKFLVFCRDYCAGTHYTMPEGAFDSFDSPRRPSKPADILGQLDVVKIDDEIFWRTLMVHDKRHGNLARKVSSDEVREDALCLAARIIKVEYLLEHFAPPARDPLDPEAVLLPRALPGFLPDEDTEGPIIHYKDSGLDLWAETSLGQLSIQRDDSGEYFWLDQHPDAPEGFGRDSSMDEDAPILSPTINSGHQ
jgi:hypothetical protein